MRLKKSLLAVSTALTLTLTGVASATADDATPDSPVASTEEVLAVKGFLSKYGVSQTDQDTLVTAILAGELTEADSDSSTPISTETRLGETVTRFSDGSVRVESVQQPVVKGGGVSTMGIGGCTVSGGSGYSNKTGCKINYTTPVFNFHFYADFTNVQGGPDVINRAYGGQIVYAIGHTATSEVVKVPRKTEAGANAALAQYSIRFETAKLITVSKGANLNVGRDTYW